MLASMDAESDFLGGVLKIALGIALGGVLLWAAMEYRSRYEAYQAELERQAAAQQLELRRASEVAARARQAEWVRVERERLQAVKALAMEQKRRKEAAWNRYFKPSAECLDASSVECGNQYIRARREFEVQYRDHP
jgi:hypothetical protein